MNIHYKDGGVLNCYSIVPYNGTQLVADEFYIIDIDDVEEITEDYSE